MKALCMNQCIWPSQMTFAVTLLAGVASGEDAFLSRWQDIRNRQPEGVSLVLLSRQNRKFRFPAK